MSSTLSDWTSPQGPDNYATYDTPGAQAQPSTSDLRANIEDQDYAKALAASREEHSKSNQSQFLGFSDRLLTPSPDSALKKIQDQHRKDQEVNMVLSMSNEFAPLSVTDADTMIYIGPPPKARGQSTSAYRYV